MLLILVVGHGEFTAFMAVAALACMWLVAIMLVLSVHFRQVQSQSCQISPSDVYITSAGAPYKWFRSSSSNPKDVITIPLHRIQKVYICREIWKRYVFWGPLFQVESLYIKHTVRPSNQTIKNHDQWLWLNCLLGVVDARQLRRFLWKRRMIARRRYFAYIRTLRLKEIDRHIQIAQEQAEAIATGELCLSGLSSSSTDQDGTKQNPDLCATSPGNATAAAAVVKEVEAGTGVARDSGVHASVPDFLELIDRLETEKSYVQLLARVSDFNELIGRLTIEQSHFRSSLARSSLHNTTLQQAMAQLEELRAVDESTLATLNGKLSEQANARMFALLEVNGNDDEYDQLRKQLRQLDMHRRKVWQASLVSQGSTACSSKLSEKKTEDPLNNDPNSGAK